MKILILTTLCFYSVVSFAQINTFSSYRDYPITDNIDSLKKIVQQNQKNTEFYLHGIIAVERLRILLKNDISFERLDSIQALAVRQKSMLAMAANKINYANAYQIKGNNLLAVQSFLEAKDKFEKINDTNGLLTAYGGLIQINYEKDLIRGSRQNAKYYFNKLMVLSKNSNFEIDKIFGLRYIIECNALLDKRPTANEIEKAFTQIITIVEKKPSLKILKLNYFIRIQRGYNTIKAYDKQLKYALIELNYVNNKAQHWNYFHVADAYNQVGKYDSSLVYLKKAMFAYKQQKVFGLEQLALYFKNYIDVLRKLEKYQEALNANFQMDSLNNIIYKTSQQKAIVELQTKYETEKKDITIKKLQLEKQIAQSQFRQTMSGLLLAVIISGAFGLLALRLRKTNQNLRLLQQSKDKLFMIISHDLRSPLNTFMGYTELVEYLIETNQPHKLKSVFRQVDELGKNLSLMLNNILAWSVSEQKNTLKPSSIELAPFFKELLSVYKSIANFKSIAWKEDFLEQRFTTDPNVLSLITRNLLDNALKYTEIGQQISFSFKVDNHKLIITITNQANRIPFKKQRKIQNLFEGTKTYELGEDGLGIGLITVQQYAKMNQTKLSFKQDSNGLVTFEVVITR
jgi:signal transduction histidine kinase